MAAGEPARQLKWTWWFRRSTLFVCKLEPAPPLRPRVRPVDSGLGKPRKHKERAHQPPSRTLPAQLASPRRAGLSSCAACRPLVAGRNWRRGPIVTRPLRPALNRVAHLSQLDELERGARTRGAIRARSRHRSAGPSRGEWQILNWARTLFGPEGRGVFNKAAGFESRARAGPSSARSIDRAVQLSVCLSVRGARAGRA